MSLIEKKLDAVMHCLAADNEADRERARNEIRSLLKRNDAPPANRNLEYDVRRVLLDIGVPEGLVGHRYLVRAICLVVQEPELLNSITKRLYPDIAKEYNATGSRVERGIRHAIEVALERCDMDTFMRYFGNTVDPSKGKPTNREFIGRISNVVRQYAE